MCVVAVPGLPSGLSPSLLTVPGLLPSGEKQRLAPTPQSRFSGDSRFTSPFQVEGGVWGSLAAFSGRRAGGQTSRGTCRPRAEGGLVSCAPARAPHAGHRSLPRGPAPFCPSRGGPPGHTRVSQPHPSRVRRHTARQEPRQGRERSAWASSGAERRSSGRRCVPSSAESSPATEAQAHEGGDGGLRTLGHSLVRSAPPSSPPGPTGSISPW